MLIGVTIVPQIKGSENICNSRGRHRDYKMSPEGVSNRWKSTLDLPPGIYLCCALGNLKQPRFLLKGNCHEVTIASLAPCCWRRGSFRRHRRVSAAGESARVRL